MENLSLMTHAASALPWPPHVQIVRMDTDSMEPTLLQGDYVAVDTSQREVREGIFLMQFGQATAVVRRIQPSIVAGGPVLVGTDNRVYGEPTPCPREEIAPAIVGRVIFYERKMP